MAKKTSGSMLTKWMDAARAVPAEQAGLKVPLQVLRGEALDVARFVDHYWKPEGERPGLSQAVKKKAGAGEVFGPTVGAEIVELETAVGEAHSAWVRSAHGSSSEPLVERGGAAIEELSRVLEWHFDDGVDDENDAQLARVAAQHANTGASIDAVSAELEDYVALAQAHRAELDGLLGFDVAHVDAAKALAKELRASPRPESNEDEKASSAALALRNGVAALLYQRMQRVRAAARVTFVKHPAIAREATSAYERRKRAEARREKAKKGE